MRTLLPIFLVSLFCVCVQSVRAVETDRTEWNEGTGAWTDAAHWSNNTPTGFERVIVSGKSTVTIPQGVYLAGDLEVGVHAGDQARVIVDGGQLIIAQDSLRVAEYTGGNAEFVLKDGAVHSVMDVFLGAASALPGRENHGIIRIQGGSFLGRTITVGLGWGAESLFSVEGSRATAIHALDFVAISANTNPKGRPGVSTLSFTLDEHGVTPITIQSTRQGLRIERDEASHARLEIHLSAVPPREDITLVASHVPAMGMFEGMPEGSPITATFNGQTYTWKLTYRGGKSHADLALVNTTQFSPDAPVTHTRGIPEPPAPLWLAHPLYPLAIEQGTPAFEGAEGYGADTPGGRGGTIIDVTSLADAGPGTLREAIETDGPRIIRFQVGGVIPLKSTLIIKHPFLTLDGQSAPAPGILIRDHGLEVHSHDIILRHFRIRIGDDDARAGGKSIAEYQSADGENALYFTDGSSHCIADHLSLSWSTNKLLCITKMSDLITVQWCILSESLNFAGHGYASIAGGNRTTWHHNLFAHNQSRSVRFQGAVEADFRNNVVYDWGGESAYGEFDHVNYVGNYLKPGPSTTQRPHLFHNGEAVAIPGTLFVADNMMEGEPKVAADNWRGMGYYYFERHTLAALHPFPMAPVTTESAQSAYDHVLAGAGATLPQRDSVDARIVDEVRNGTGHIIKWVSETPGWPEFFSPATAPAIGKH